jgi:hypothetical protein
MIERQIDNPMPMPLDLVVKKGLNSRSACSAEIPTPQSSTITITSRLSPWFVRITSWRGEPHRLLRLLTKESDGHLEQFFVEVIAGASRP